MRFLPPEISRLICISLSRADLKSLRLVSRAWNETSRQMLFNTVLLRNVLESLQHLGNISLHEMLREHVRHISYDSRAKREDVQYNSPTVQQMLCKDCEEDMLLQALSLPGLVGVESRSWDGGSSLLRDHDIYHHTDADPERSFWGLVRMARVSDRAGRMSHVGGSCFALEDWEAIAAHHVECFTAFTALENLTLDFESTQQPSFEHLTRIISQATSLKTLRLWFEASREGIHPPCVPLQDIVCNDGHWKRLRCLSLQSITCTEQFLRGFLNNHHRTLRSLELNDVEFVKEIGQEGYESGSWVWFFQFVSKTMSLAHVSFSGELTNNRDERWLTGEKGDDWWEEYFCEATGMSLNEYSKDCLRYRIEQFITGGGSCPFTARTRDAGSQDEPWEFDGDESWNRYDYFWVDRRPESMNY